LKLLQHSNTGNNTSDGNTLFTEEFITIKTNGYGCANILYDTNTLLYVTTTMTSIVTYTFDEVVACHSVMTRTVQYRGYKLEHQTATMTIS
jgi:hypothetical protein